MKGDAFPQGRCLPMELRLNDHSSRRAALQVQSGLNLSLTLKNPSQMRSLLAAIARLEPVVRDALESLHYVHFARFLPTRDGSQLFVITSYDGDLKTYIMDFVAVLGDVFTIILEYMRDAPRLPVKDYPGEFWAYVQKNNALHVPLWSAYPDMTVIEILEAQKQVRL